MSNTERNREILKIVKQVMADFTTHEQRQQELKNRLNGDELVLAISMLMQRERHEEQKQTAIEDSIDDEPRPGEIWYPVTDEDLLLAYIPVERIKNDSEDSRRDSSSGKAEVWLCTSKRDAKKRAVVKYGSASDMGERQKQVSQTLAESQALYGFYHPNVIRIFASGKLKARDPNSVPYISMEYIKGKTLRKWRTKHSELSPQEAARIVIVLCDAIQKCHEERIIHMDLSPNNVIVADSETGVADATTLKLIDFGAAAINFVDLQVSSPDFCAPWRDEPGHEPEPADDIFALAGLLCFLITGKTNVSSDFAARKGEYSYIDSDLCRIVERAITPDRHRRYLSARQLKEDLEAWVTLHPLAYARTKQEYTKQELQKLMLKRCAIKGNIVDVTQLIAQASVWLVAILGLGIGIFVAVKLTGLSESVAVAAASHFVNVAAVLLFVQCLWRARFQRSALKMFMPIFAFMVAMCLNYWLVLPAAIGLPTDTDTRSSVMFVMFMLGVMTVALGNQTDEWWFLQIPGWIVLCSVPVIRYWSDHGLTHDAMLPMLFAAEAMCSLTFIAFGFPSEKPTSTAQPVVPLLETIK